MLEGILFLQWSAPTNNDSDKKGVEYIVERHVTGSSHLKSDRTTTTIYPKITIDRLDPSNQFEFRVFVKITEVIKSAADN